MGGIVLAIQAYPTLTEKFNIYFLLFRKSDDVTSARPSF